MRSLIIGAGSIGLRHADILKNMGLECDFVTKRNDISYSKFKKINDVNLDSYNYIIIANETSKHYDTFCEINRKVSNKKVLIENPLFSEKKTISNLNNDYFLGYNLRFHEAVKYLKSNISSASILNIELICCHYLPDWNTWRDYRSTYSAKSDLGGGVLKDLTHEIDLLFFITEQSEAKFISKTYSKISDLEIETNDFFRCVGKVGNISFSVGLDYISRIPRRQIVVYTNQYTFIIDLIEEKISKKGTDEEINKKFSSERNSTYEEMHKSILFHGGVNASTIHDGYRVLSWF